MNFWRGRDVNTGFSVAVYDSPLRIDVEDPYTGKLLIFKGAAVKRLAIATSAILGTALYALLPDGEDGLIVVEAAAESDIPSGRYMAAMAEARQYIEREIELERVWDDTTADTDLEKLVRAALRRP